MTMAEHARARRGMPLGDRLVMGFKRPNAGWRSFVAAIPAGPVNAHLGDVGQRAGRSRRPVWRREAGSNPRRHAFQAHLNHSSISPADFSRFNRSNSHTAAAPDMQHFSFPHRHHRRDFRSRTPPAWASVPDAIVKEGLDDEPRRPGRSRSSRAAPRPSSCRSTTTRPAPRLDPAVAEPAQASSGNPAPNADIPIYLYGETRTARHASRTTSLRELHGFIHMFEDTPEFVARTSSARPRHVDPLAPPPFFRR